MSLPVKYCGLGDLNIKKNHWMQYDHLRESSQDIQALNFICWGKDLRNRK